MTASGRYRRDGASEGAHEDNALLVDLKSPSVVEDGAEGGWPVDVKSPVGATERASAESGRRGASSKATSETEIDGCTKRSPRSNRSSISPQRPREQLDAVASLDDQDTSMQAGVSTMLNPLYLGFSRIFSQNRDFAKFRLW